MQECSLFSTPSPVFIVCRHFDDGHSDQCEMISHYNFDLHFSGPITSWEIDGETVEAVSDFIFWAPKSLQMVTAAMKLKDAYSLEGKL